MATPPFIRCLVDLSIRENAVIIKGRDFSGKTALLRWLFLRFSENHYPILVDGNGILKSLNFEDHFRRKFKKEFRGDFDTWKTKDNKIAIIDNFHHKISSNLSSYLRENFVMTIIGMDEEEYMVYFRDEPAFAEYSILSLEPLSLSKQEELIRTWMQVGEKDEQTLDDLIIDKLEERVNTVITSNRVVPRFPFYVLSILQSLEAFMPKDYSITAYGHCYHALIVAQLYKKNISSEQIDSCFNYLKELSFDIFINNSNGNKVYEMSNYREFRENYKKRFFILEATINRIENDDYPILRFSDDIVRFEYQYINYYFLGMYLASNSKKDIVNGLVDDIHLKQNSLIIIFTIHHAQNKELLETILAHCVCSFDKVSPAELSTIETKFMNTLVSELPKNIISNKDVAENRRTQRNRKDQILANSDDESDDDITNTDMSRGMRIMDVLGQILKNRAGSFEKASVLEALEATIDLGLRILNLFLNECRKPEFQEWLSKVLEDAEREQDAQEQKAFDDQKRIKFVEKTIQFFGHMVTIGMLNRISYSIANEKLLDAISTLSERKNTPAYRMVNFMVDLSQNGINMALLRELSVEFSKSKNYWAQIAVSFQVQNYLNTHKIGYKEAQKINDLLGIKYLPKGNLK